MPERIADLGLGRCVQPVTDSAYYLAVVLRSVGLDFRQFSAVYRPQIKDYRFSSKPVLE